MAQRETPLQTAERLVADQERRVARQREIVEELAASGFSAAVAKDTLALMDKTLTMLRRDRDWLEANKPPL